MGNIINEEFLQQVETLQMLIKNNVAGQFGGNHQSKSFGASCEFSDYRDYVAGDDISKIDWNAYARFDKLFLKLYLDERQMHNKIYIDASRSMMFGDAKKAEQTIKIAATLAYLSICQMDKVSIYVIRGNKLNQIISGIIGKEAFVNSIHKLNEIEFYGDSSITEAILPESVGYGDGMSVIISDFLTDSNYEEAIDYLVSKRRHVFALQLLSREEINPFVRGKVHFLDSEDVEKTYRKNIDKEIIKAYKLAVEYATNRIRNYCNARGADYALVSAEDSIAEIFLSKLNEMGVVK